MRIDIPICIETLKPFHATEITYRDAEVLVSRTGFTGDLGYELWLDPRHADALWDDLMANNDACQVKPFGSRALDLLRLEAGFVRTSELRLVRYELSL